MANFSSYLAKQTNYFIGYGRQNDDQRTDAASV